MEDQAEQRQHEREDAARAEVAGRPQAGIGLTVSGAVEGSWTGQLPARVLVQRPRPPSPQEQADDPGAGLGGLWVDLEAVEGDEPEVAGQPLYGWTFWVPDYDGPGTYDLVEIVRRLESVGLHPDYFEWQFSLGSWEEAWYWTPDAGAGTVEVGEDERSMVVRLATQGAGGDLSVAASVNIPEPMLRAET